MFGDTCSGREEPCCPQAGSAGLSPLRVHLSLHSLLRNLPTPHAGIPSHRACGSAGLPGPRGPNTGTPQPGPSECLGCSQGWGCQGVQGCPRGWQDPGGFAAHPAWACRVASEQELGAGGKAPAGVVVIPLLQATWRG